MIRNISVIIPAYKEEGRIRPTLEKIALFFDKANLDYEILVSIDGDAAGTIKIIDSLGNKKIKTVLNGEKRAGKGLAIKNAVEKARFDWILTTDADLSTPIEEIDKFLPYTDKYSLIIGSRRMDKTNEESFYRKINGQAFNLTVRLFLLRGIRDTQCGFKLIKADLAKRIFRKQRIGGYGFDVEMLYMARKYGEKIKEIPVMFKNAKGSKINYLKDSAEMLADIIRVRINDRRGRY